MLREERFLLCMQNLSLLLPEQEEILMITHDFVKLSKKPGRIRSQKMLLIVLSKDEQERTRMQVRSSRFFTKDMGQAEWL